MSRMGAQTRTPCLVEPRDFGCGVHLFSPFTWYGPSTFSASIFFGSSSKKSVISKRPLRCFESMATLLPLMTVIFRSLWRPERAHHGALHRLGDDSRVARDDLVPDVGLGVAGECARSGLRHAAEGSARRKHEDRLLLVRDEAGERVDAARGSREVHERRAARPHRDLAVLERRGRVEVVRAVVLRRVSAPSPLWASEGRSA